MTPLIMERGTLWTAVERRVGRKVEDLELELGDEPGEYLLRATVLPGEHEVTLGVVNTVMFFRLKDKLITAVTPGDLELISPIPWPVRRLR